MTKVTASKVYYIKLGMGGEWEAECLKEENSFGSTHHQTSSEVLRGDYSKPLLEFLARVPQR